MHRNLYRVSIDQCLDTFGLVSVGQLVCSVYIDFDLAASCFFDQFSELTAAFCPGTGFSGGAGEVPGLLRPVEIASVFYIVGACRRCIFLCKGFNQIFGIVITCGFQFLLIPRIYTVYRQTWDQFLILLVAEFLCFVLFVGATAMVEGVERFSGWFRDVI